MPHETGSIALAKRRYSFRKTLPAPFSCKGAGIYAIINCLNGKIYIGSAVRLNHRWTEHRRELEDGTHGNRYLQAAFRKDPDAFQISVIELIAHPHKSSLLAREQLWIDFYRSYLPENGYNIAPKAESCQGIKRDKETIAKAVAGRKPWSEARKLAWKEYCKTRKLGGWKWSNEARKRHSVTLTGKRQTEATCRKRARKLKGRKYPYRGRAVIQLAPSGEEVCRFEAIAYAASKLGIKECNIRDAIRHPQRHAGGFKWRDANAA